MRRGKETDTYKSLQLQESRSLSKTLLLLQVDKNTIHNAVSSVGRKVLVNNQVQGSLRKWWCFQKRPKEKGSSKNIKCIQTHHKWKSLKLVATHLTSETWSRDSANGFKIRQVQGGWVVRGRKDPAPDH